MISKIIAEDQITKVKKAIDGVDKIVIVAHVGPDGINTCFVALPDDD